MCDIQGSILSLILFCLYLFLFGHVIQQNDILLLGWWFTILTVSGSKQHGYHQSINDVRNWMSYNFLQLNTDKTEILIIVQKQNTAHVKQALGSLAHIKPMSRNLWVIFEEYSSLNFEPHVNILVQQKLVWLLSVKNIISIIIILKIKISLSFEDRTDHTCYHISSAICTKLHCPQSASHFKPGHRELPFPTTCFCSQSPEY